MKKLGKKNKWVKMIVNMIVFVIYQVAEFFISLIPLPVLAMMGSVLGKGFYFISGKYRRLVKHNMRIVFAGQWDEKKITEQAKMHFSSLGKNLLTALKVPMMKDDEVKKYIDVVNLEKHKQLLEEVGSIVYVVCHQSCWEMLPHLNIETSPLYNPAAFYQPLTNPYLNKILLKRRAQMGYKLFDRKEGLGKPSEHLRRGGQIGFFVDQHTGDLGVWCPLFGRLASTTPLAALFAQKNYAVLLPIAVYDNGFCRWKLEIGEPLKTKGLRDIEKVTAMINEAIEKVILKQPHSWFWVHNRWKTPRYNYLIRNYRRGVAHVDGYDMSQLNPFEIIVRSPNWLGDACMALPAVRALKAGRPDARITVFGLENLRGFWMAQPEVSEYIGKQKEDSMLKAAGLISKNGRHYDIGILMTNSTRSTVEFWWSGKVRRLIGYKGSARSWLLDSVVPEPKGEIYKHHLHRYLAIAYFGGAKQGVDYWKAEERTSVVKGRVGICAGAEYGPAKRWGIDSYVQMMKMVAQKGVAVDWWLFGAPAEKEMGVEMSKKLEGLQHQNWVGQTSMTELIDKLKSCEVLVTNDTGTMHLAAAMGVPTISIFGSTEPEFTGPMGSQHVVHRKKQECSPCFERTCKFEHYRCLTEITAEEIAESVITKIQVES
jgi:lipopolysaccharide heptosyltransferase II